VVFLIAKGFFFSFLCFFLGGGKRDLILAKASYLGKETMDPMQTQLHFCAIGLAQTSLVPS
jgi:hypothetical protein